MTTLHIPEGIQAYEPRTAELPEGWNSKGYTADTRAFGDAFIKEGRHLLMRVPSAIVPGEFNFLINPQHEAVSSINIISIEPFVFDERLFGKGPRR